MVETLLNTAAMEKSEFSLSKEEADLHDLIRSAALMYDEAIKQKEGKIIFELNASLPLYFVMIFMSPTL